MARNKTRHLKSERQKKLAKLFDEACYRHNQGSVWSDFVTMAAIAISNRVDESNAPDREKLYMQLAGKYNEKELTCMAEMFAEIVAGIEENPDQDFLGELFMCLELSNSFAGQFFTPYSLCQFMARCTAEKDHLMEQIEQKGWISVSDPACGAGALLVAFANWCLECDVNYQTSVLFVAQDIDYTVGCMCYIQLSLMGCPGYVVIDDSLRRPSTSHDDRGLIPVHGPKVWYTPFYFRDVWHYRRTWWTMDRLVSATAASMQTSEIMPEPEPVSVPAAKPMKRKPVAAQPALKETNIGQLTLF